MGAEAAELLGALSSPSSASLLYRNRRALLARAAMVAASTLLLAGAGAVAWAIASSSSAGLATVVLTGMPLLLAAVGLAALAKRAQRYVLAVDFRPQGDEVLLSTLGLIGSRTLQLDATAFEGAHYVDRIGRGLLARGPWLAIDVDDGRRLLLDLDAEIEDVDFLEFVLGGLVPAPDLPAPETTEAHASASGSGR